MRRKKLLNVFLLVNMLVGCTSQKKVDEVCDVGIVVYDASDVFLKSVTDQLEEYTSTDSSIRFSLQGAERSQTKENSIVDDFISNGVDILCVNLVDRTETSYIINAAKNANIPVIFFNREPVTSDLKRWSSLYYVGSDSEDGGTLQGQLIAKYIKQHPEVDKNNDGVIQYYIYEGEVGHQDAIARTEAATATLIDSGYKIEKIGYSICNWTREEAKQSAIKMIQNYKDIELIISNNDDMAAGVVDAYQSLNISIEDRPILAGVDGTEVGLELVENGSMIGTVYQDAKGYSEIMYSLSKALFNNEDISDFDFNDNRVLYLPYQEVTINNIDKFK